MLIGDLAANLGLEEDEFNEVFELYMETTNSDLQGLKRALNNGDAEEAHLRAHSIKGASANLSLNDLYELAKKIDDNTRSNVLAGVEGMIRDFEERYGKLVERFERGRNNP